MELLRKAEVPLNGTVVCQVGSASIPPWAPVTNNASYALRTITSVESTGHDLAEWPTVCPARRHWYRNCFLGGASVHFV